MRTDPKQLVRMMTPTATRMLEAGVGRAASSQHAEVTVEHVLAQFLQDADGEAAGILHEFGQDRNALLQRVEEALRGAHNGATARPMFSEILFRWFEGHVAHGEH